MRYLIPLIGVAGLLSGCGSSSSSKPSPVPTGTLTARLATIPVTTPVATPKGGFPTADTHGTPLKLPTSKPVAQATNTSIPGKTYTATLHGMVTDAKSGAPIAGVVIAVGAGSTHETTTDAFGRYSLAFPGGPMVPVTATVSGYFQSLQMGSLSPHQTYALDFKLIRKAQGQAPPPPSIFGKH